MEMLSTSDRDIEKAAAALKAGLLVAFPTETVYGLGADAFNLSALARVFEAKNRPRFDPLIIHIAEIGDLDRVVDMASLNSAVRERLSMLSDQLWPGPLTLVLPKRSELPDLATAGLATAAVRFPSHPAAQKLVRLSTGAIAAPSANPFGCLSPTRAAHVKDLLGEKVDYIIDGGRTQVGIESTVLDISGLIPRILRPGGTSREAIEAVIGLVEFGAFSVAGAEAMKPQALEPQVAPMSPGQLKSHYAPGTPLVLYKSGELSSLPETPGEGRLYFSTPKNMDEKRSGDSMKVLSRNGDLCEAAANLFDMLHELDGLGLSLIRAEEAPCHGLGLAINDRLKRGSCLAEPGIKHES